MMERRKKKLDNYLDRVCAEVRAKGMHREIREELSGHFQDLMLERQQLGATEEEAQQYAIAQMGDPQVIGRGLHKIHKPRSPWGLLTAVMMLSAVSLLGMGAIEAGTSFNPALADLTMRQTVFIILGIAVMTGMYFFNFKLLQRASGFIYAAALMAIVASLLLGPELINGNRRYVGFMGFYFDLVGYSPYIFVVALTGIWTSHSFVLKWSGRTRELAELALLLLPAAIYAAIRSLPELVVYLAVSLTLYVWITRRWVTAGLMVITFVSGGAIYVWNNMNLRDRVIGAINHNYMLNGPGYLNRRIYEAITSAGWRGFGFGGAEEGLPGWFVLKMISYARAVRDTYGRMLILALALMLAIRLTYGLSILSGRMLITAIPFPFLSYGQHVFIEFAAVGLLMGVYRRKDMLPADTSLDLTMDA
jgi:cell division protein FtsW (lipid II flippase)